MKRLINVTAGSYGVLEDFMIMDEEPVLGQWRITVKARSHNDSSGLYYSEEVMYVQACVWSMVDNC